MTRVNAMHGKKAQSIVEFSLLVVLIVVALVGIQAFVNRAIQGRMRSSADSIGEQFSPNWTESDRLEIVSLRAIEHTEVGVLTRNMNQSFSSTEDRVIDSLVAEGAAL